jgi:putative Ca2+/H+ antiporter (TMEM165/GDT1 family)
MDWKIFLTAFGTIFLAELGDKTQLATLLYAAKSPKPLSVFIASSLALVLSSALAVAFGSVLGNYIPANIVSKIAGAGFIVIGIFLVLGKF